jgi:hypothetical protein
MFAPNTIKSDDVGAFSWMGYRCREEPSAEDYLEYARLDLADGKSPRHLINALANAKRALHMRMEDVCLGFGAVSLENMRGFHRLAKYLKKCGLPAPSVLEKLNSTRNSIEHDYAIPSLELVEIYTDVAHLFLSATDRWSARHPCDIELYEINETQDKRLRGVTFNWKRGEVTLLISDAETRGPSYPHSITYTNQDPQFFEWVSFAVKYST